MKGHLDSPVPEVVEVGDSTVWRFATSSDARGNLVPIEFSPPFPFLPTRVFFISHVSPSAIRGDHAHRECQQLLIAASGRVSVLVDNGRESAEIVLAEPSVGLHIPPLVWARQYDFTTDAVLVVFASLPYDPGDYIHDYETFLQESGPIEPDHLKT